MDSDKNHLYNSILEKETKSEYEKNMMDAYESNFRFYIESPIYIEPIHDILEINDDITIYFNFVSQDSQYFEIAKMTYRELKGKRQKDFIDIVNAKKAHVRKSITDKNANTFIVEKETLFLECNRSAQSSIVKNEYENVFYTMFKKYQNMLKYHSLLSFRYLYKDKIVYSTNILKNDNFNTVVDLICVDDYGKTVANTDISNFSKHDFKKEHDDMFNIHKNYIIHQYGIEKYNQWSKNTTIKKWAWEHYSLNKIIELNEKSTNIKQDHIDKEDYEISIDLFHIYNLHRDLHRDYNIYFNFNKATLLKEFGYGKVYEWSIDETIKKEAYTQIYGDKIIEKNNVLGFKKKIYIKVNDTNSSLLKAYKLINENIPIHIKIFNYYRETLDEIHGTGKVEFWYTKTEILESAYEDFVHKKTYRSSYINENDDYIHDKLYKVYSEKRIVIDFLPVSNYTETSYISKTYGYQDTFISRSVPGFRHFVEPNILKEDELTVQTFSESDFVAYIPRCPIQYNIVNLETLLKSINETHWIYNCFTIKQHSDTTGPVSYDQRSNKLNIPINSNNIFNDLIIKQVGLKPLRTIKDGKYHINIDKPIINSLCEIVVDSDDTKPSHNITNEKKDLTPHNKSTYINIISRTSKIYIYIPRLSEHFDKDYKNQSKYIVSLMRAIVMYVTGISDIDTFKFYHEYNLYSWNDSQIITVHDMYLRNLLIHVPDEITEKFNHTKHDISNYNLKYNKNVTMKDIYALSVGYSQTIIDMIYDHADLSAEHIVNKEILMLSLHLNRLLGYGVLTTSKIINTWDEIFSIVIKGHNIQSGSGNISPYKTFTAIMGFIIIASMSIIPR